MTGRPRGGPSQVVSVVLGTRGGPVERFADVFRPHQRSPTREIDHDDDPTRIHRWLMASSRALGTLPGLRRRARPAPGRCEAATRPARVLPSPGTHRRRPPARVVSGLQAPVAQALRRLGDTSGDLRETPGAPRRFRSRVPRALPRLADAAPARADAALVRAHLRDEPLRASGASGRSGDSGQRCGRRPGDVASARRRRHQRPVDPSRPTSWSISRVGLC